MELKTVKAMWLVNAKELQVALKKPVPASCCENRYKVLDRNYKKFVENKTSTGRGRKYFEFADEMAELFMGKKSVVPQLLLSTSTIHEPEVERHMATDESIKEREITTVTNSTYKDVAESAINSENIRIRNRKRKATVIETLLQSRLKYQESRLNIENQKLKELQTRNALLRERNEILKQKNCSCDK